jgi:hypothetical protein
MKLNKSVLFAFVLMIIVGSVCRVLGFAPQIAMAIFGVAVIKDKKLAFLLPLVSMLLSDVLYEVLYRYGVMEYGGFYSGQITNYILIAAVGLFGLLAVNRKPVNIMAAAIAAPTVFFIISNFLVWLGGGGFHRPKTVEGLIQCFVDAVPFYRNGLVSTAVFSMLLFGGYYLLQRLMVRKEQLA